MFCGSTSIVILQSVVVGVVAPLGHPCNASVWCDSSGVTQWWVERCGVRCREVWCVCPVVWSHQTRGDVWSERCLVSGQRGVWCLVKEMSGVWSERCLDSRETDF